MKLNNQYIVILKGLIFFIIWKIVYLIYLKPERTLDSFLTTGTANTVYKIVSFINPPNDSLSNSNYRLVEKTTVSSIYLGTKKLIGVEDGCNALELYVLYIGFLFCFMKNKPIFYKYLFGGVFFIFLLNIIRILLLLFINMKYSLLFDFTHHYLFSAIVYVSIFILWKKYLKAVNF
jgi:exosortase/archaeosortase family protein